MVIMVRVPMVAFGMAATVAAALVAEGDRPAMKDHLVAFKKVLDNPI